MIASRFNVLRSEQGAEQNFDEQLPLFVRIRNADYRAAVAQIIRDIKADAGKTNEELAEDGGCGESTIANAEKQSGNLDAVTLLNIVGNNGGERRFKTVLALMNGAPAKLPTLADRLDRIEREAAAIRKELPR